MSKSWKLKPQPPVEIRERLADISPLIVQLLYNRDLTDPAKIRQFIETKYEDQHDPFLFGDMQKAVNRIWQAIEQDEKICIYGDYDADAVTANAVLQQAFRYVHKDLSSYIPDRFTEGYGLNLDAFEKIHQQGCTVVITVDCGTNSIDVAEFCKKNGIDLIITDHHEIIGPKPDAFALINPKNPDDTYPYHEITGVGVAFKLAYAVLQSPKSLVRNPKLTPGSEKWLLDLVAIGTVADCHSLMGENRIFVKYGLKVLQKTRWVGLQALGAVTNNSFQEKVPDTYTLGFVIAPRLNAAGRLEHADIALHTLLEKDPVQALERAQALETVNLRRQEMTGRIVSEAKEQVMNIADRKVLVVAGEGWNKGIVGLVAGRLAEEYHKPVMVLEKTATESTGSARTVGKFDVVESLKYAAEFLTRFGGHKQAAGLTLPTENLEKFYEKILEYAETHLRDEDLEHLLWLDAELSPKDLQLDTYSLIAQLEPFGVDNPKPKFFLPQLVIVGSKMVGVSQQHIQFRFRVGSKEISSIYFNCGDFAKNLKIGDTVDVAAELLCDSWNGRETLKLRIIDLQQSQGTQNRVG